MHGLANRFSLRSRRRAAFLALGAACGVAGCQPARDQVSAAAGGSVPRDDYGDSVRIGESRPSRVVSLNPTTTEMLFAIGAGTCVVGRTHWDTYPPAARSVADVGDGLRPNVEAVLALHPDFVVLYASADDRPADLAFRRAGVPTLALRVDRVSDFARALELLGRVMHDSAAAATVEDSVVATIRQVRARTAGLPIVTVAWVVEQQPLLVIGGGSYLNELLADAGARNVYGGISESAQQVSLEDLLERDPDVVLTSPRFVRAMRADPRWHGWVRDPRHRIIATDTALMGMPSVRMGEATEQLAGLLHPSAGT